MNTTQNERGTQQKLISFTCLKCQSVPFITLATINYIHIKCRCGLRKMISIKDYIEIMKNQASKREKEVNLNKCKIHINKEYQFYCINCDAHMCSNCHKEQNSIHQFHRIVNLQTYLDNNGIKDIKKQIKTAQEYINIYYSTIQEIIMTKFDKNPNIENIYNSNLSLNKEVLSLYYL